MQFRNYKGDLFFGHNQFYVDPVNVTMTGEAQNPLSIYLFGTAFYGTRLQPSLPAATPVYLIGNESKILAKGIVEEGEAIQENAPPTAVAKLALALDDLRRLGEVDWQMNYPHLDGGK